MQASELDHKNNKFTGDVESINFRPSPNFKNMRKYLKAHSSPNQSSDRSTSPPNEEQVNRESEIPQASTSRMAQPSQPPLPPNSPPPDLVVPKQEVEDEEYNDRVTVNPEPKVEAGEVKAEKPPEKTMCRQFARGTCTRGTSCIYVHELILSQLPGVYTFCKNFQNSICKYPMCKFVHATVFEKENFYRTGYLPPHTLTHLKESNSALAPASTSAEVPSAEPTTDFMNPPPTMLSGVSALPMSGTSPPEALPLSEMHGPSPRSFPLDIPAQHEFETGGNPDVCRNCDLTTCRLLISRKLYEEKLEILEACRKQKEKDERVEARLNKLIEHINTFGQTRNKFLNVGPSSSRQVNDMDIVISGFLLKELEGRNFK